MTGDKLVNKLSIVYVWCPRVRCKSRFLCLIAHAARKFMSNAVKSDVNLCMICPIRQNFCMICPIRRKLTYDYSASNVYLRLIYPITHKFTVDLSQPDLNLHLTIACQI